MLEITRCPIFFFYVCFCTSRKFDWDNSLPLCHVIFGTCLNNHPYTHTPTARARLHTHTHTPRLVNQRYWNSFCCSSKMSEVFKTCGSVLLVWIFTVLICQKLFSFMGADVKILVGQKDSSKNPEEEQQQKPVVYSVFCFLYIHIFSDVHDNKKSLLISLFFSFCSPPPSSVIQKKTKKPNIVDSGEPSWADRRIIPYYQTAGKPGTEKPAGQSLWGSQLSWWYCWNVDQDR